MNMPVEKLCFLQRKLELQILCVEKKWQIQDILEV